MNAYTFEGEPETEPKPNGHAAGDPWTVPLPLADAPPDLPPFPLKTLGPWAGWCAEQAEAANAPVDFVAMSLLTLAGATIANTRWGSPWPGWREPPVLFTGLVGLPSSGKSPAIDTVHDPLKEAERRLAGGFDEVHRRWSTRKAEAEATRERWEREVKEAVKIGTPAPRMPEGAVTPAEPRPPRLLHDRADDRGGRRPGGARAEGRRPDPRRARRLGRRHGQVRRQRRRPSILARSVRRPIQGDRPAQVRRPAAPGPAPLGRRSWAASSPTSSRA